MVSRCDALETGHLLGRKQSMPVSIDLMTVSMPGLHCCFRCDPIHGSYTLASGSCIMSMSNFIWSDGLY